MKSVETQTDVKCPLKPILNRNSTATSTLSRKSNAKDTTSTMQSQNVTTHTKKQNQSKKDFLKEKLHKKIEKPSLSDEECTSDSSIDGAMEVEPGLDSPPNLLPKFKKQGGTKLPSAS